MLRNRTPRSAAATKPQPYAAESPAAPLTPRQSCRNQVPSFFDSPSFKALTKALADQTQTHELATASPSSVMSPTSHFSSSSVCCCSDNHCNIPFWDHVHDLTVTNPLKSPKIFSGNKHQPPTGLADLIDHHHELLTDHDHDHSNKPSQENSSPKPSNDKVLFGTKLTVQIPPLHPDPPSGSADSGNQTECHVSVSDDPIELSEEYTCVISHGPNPKTTHIFYNCIVEESYYSASDDTNEFSSVSENFLSFCHTCMKNLENNILIYRGEKAFCSRECSQYEEMILDTDEVEK